MFSPVILVGTLSDPLTSPATSIYLPRVYSACVCIQEQGLHDGRQRGLVLEPFSLTLLAHTGPELVRKYPPVAGQAKLAGRQAATTVGLGSVVSLSPESSETVKSVPNETRAALCAKYGSSSFSYILSMQAAHETDLRLALGCTNFFPPFSFTMRYFRPC